MLTKQGIVTSAKMQGTVTVTVHQFLLHPVYKKRFRSSKKFLVDLAGMKDVAVGDEVRIVECAPISKRKSFKIAEVLKRVPRVSEMMEEAAVTEQTKSAPKKEVVQSSSSSDSSDSSIK